MTECKNEPKLFTPWVRAELKALKSWEISAEETGTIAFSLSIEMFYPTANCQMLIYYARSSQSIYFVISVSYHRRHAYRRLQITRTKAVILGGTRVDIVKRLCVIFVGRLRELCPPKQPRLGFSLKIDYRFSSYLIVDCDSQTWYLSHFNGVRLSLITFYKDFRVVHVTSFCIQIRSVISSSDPH